MMSDAQVLRRAVAILRGRSRKPDGLWLRAVCNVMLDQADKIDRETPRPLPRDPGRISP